MPVQIYIIRMLMQIVKIQKNENIKMQKFKKQWKCKKISKLNCQSEESNWKKTKFIL